MPGGLWGRAFLLAEGGQDASVPQRSLGWRLRAGEWRGGGWKLEVLQDASHHPRQDDVGQDAAFRATGTPKDVISKRSAEQVRPGWLRN